MAYIDITKFLICVILILILPAAATADWSTVGGNSMRNGQSDQIGPSSADLLWEGSESAWFSGQIYIEGDKLITMRFQGIDYAPIVCHDLEDGEILWSVDFPGANSRSVPRGFRDGKIYATNFQESQHDTLYALDPEDGSVLWVSEQSAPLGIIWAVAYAGNGDLIIPGADNMLTRIDHTNGEIVWETERALPNTGAEGICVYEDKIYGWTGYINTDKKLTCWDIETGEELYASDGLPGDGDQETTPSIAPDGTIYAMRDGGSLHALEDTTGGFREKWSRTITYGSVYVQFGIGIDGSVYVPDGFSVVRLDPETGEILDRSIDLVTSDGISPRISIDAEGGVYLVNGVSNEGQFFVMTPELELLWSEPLPYNYYSGPAFGQHGTVAVSGNGTTLKVYRSPTFVHNGSSAIPSAIELNQNYPNPFNAATSIEYYLSEDAVITLTVYNSMGQVVDEIYSGEKQAGRHIVNYNADEMASGVYFYKLTTGKSESVRKMILMK